MFVNELSFHPPAVDQPTGRERATQFVHTLIASVQRGVPRILRTPCNFDALPLAHGYYWKDWRSDRRVEREVQQYFRLLASKSPFLQDEPDVESVWGEIDCLCQGQKAFGLKAAFVADGLAVSIVSSETWDMPGVAYEIHELVNEDLSCRCEEVHHASTPGHVEQQADWIQQRIRNSVEDGKDLWRHSRNFFPSLEFCPVVEDQMASLPKEVIPSIIRILFRLEAFCKDWQAGSFDRTKIGCHVTSESEPTLQQYAAERTFLCPDGERRRFRLHAKVGSWRIYFDPAPGPGRMYVGYIGRHLRTVTFG